MGSGAQKTVRVYLKSADRKGRIDGTIQRNVIAQIPNQVVNQSESDIVIVPISYYEDYEFNLELDQITKPIVLLDFCEYGASWNQQGSQVWGLSLFQDAPSCVHTASWRRFDEWARSRQPILRFVRELLQKDVTDRVKPIEFPCYLPIPLLQTKAEFDARPIEVFYQWGYSFKDRPNLHADIFRQMNQGVHVVSSFDELKANPNLPPKTWVSIHTHHSTRKPIQEILPWLLKSKITVALPGNGIKTFRHGEIVGSIMAMIRDQLAWSYPWTDNNSIGLRQIDEIVGLLHATELTDLYDIYCACDANMRKYEAKTYAKDYVLKTIESVL